MFVLFFSRCGNVNDRLTVKIIFSITRPWFNPLGLMLLMRSHHISRHQDSCSLHLVHASHLPMTLQPGEPHFNSPPSQERLLIVFPWFPIDPRNEMTRPPSFYHTHRKSTWYIFFHHHFSLRSGSNISIISSSLCKGSTRVSLTDVSRTSHGRLTRQQDVF